MKAYRDWIAEVALPTWATHGFDARGGRFRERLDLAGRSLDVPHRAMVQARQIYVFAHAAELGWFDGGAMAEQAMANLIADFCEERDGQASFAFSINGERRLHSPLRDAYTHAFVLFAIAWLHRLTGEARLLDLADRVIRFIDVALIDPAHDGLFDASPAPSEAKRQNPLMHLLEAFLFLAATAPERGYLSRADALVALFKSRLWQPGPAVLPEYFARDWTPHPDPAKAGLWEPGHHFEWVWLLAEHGRLAGADHGEIIDALDRSARRHGLAPGGLIVDEVAIDGAVTKPSHRVWPHTEAIKAAVAQAARGHAGAQDFASDMAGALMSRFLDRPFAGGWIDHIAADGTPLVDYVPASSLYHLFLAAAESTRIEAGAIMRQPEAAHG